MQQTVIYNRNNFTAVYTAVVSRFGLREYWDYFRNRQKVYWSSLTWDEQRLVAGAYIRAWDTGKIWLEAKPPCKFEKIRNWFPDM